jgi:hypothetical protein
MIIGGVLLLFVLTLWLGIRIQERQHYVRTMQNAYLAKLHEILKTPQLETLPGAVKPKHQGSYAFRVQTILSASFAIGLIAFIIYSVYIAKVAV